MTIKRRDLIRHFENNGFYLLREGARHSIYSDGDRVVPVNRHRSTGS